MKISIPFGKLPRAMCVVALCAIFLISNVAKADGPGVLESTKARSDFALTADPDSKNWKGVSGVIASQSPFGKPLPEAKTEIRSRWTKKNVYFLFIANYQTMYLRPTPNLNGDTVGLWDYDVDEIFLGNDFKNIDVYKEFEMSPQGEFVDLDVDRNRKGNTADATWNAGLRFKTRVDKEHKIWYGEMEIPWKSVATQPARVGAELRLNLYRIEGGPKDRKYIVWQVTNSPSFHTPEAFGRLRLVK